MAAALDWPSLLLWPPGWRRQSPRVFIDRAVLDFLLLSILSSLAAIVGISRLLLRLFHLNPTLQDFLHYELPDLANALRIVVFESCNVTGCQGVELFRLDLEQRLTVVVVLVVLVIGILCEVIILTISVRGVDLVLWRRTFDKIW